MQNFPGVIYLCGFMGVGKSTVGILLADELSCPFFDTDLLVTSQTGRSIPEIFSSEGEPGFRKRESEALRSPKIKAPCVVSLGGGILNIPANLEHTLQSGTLIYLAANPKTLADRLSETTANRPLLSGLSTDARKNKIVSLLHERESIYRKATLQIDTDNKEAEAVVAEILSRLPGRTQ